MRARTLPSTLLAGLALAAACYAAPAAARHGVDVRQHHQRDRIEQGWRSGDLNRHEARGLAREQRYIRGEERHYRSDGRLGPWERRDLQRDLNRSSRHIYNQRHDGQYRGMPGWRGIDRREASQARHIRDGWRRGDLTRDESRTLWGEQRSIRDQERTYRSDGTFTRDERRDLRQDLNTARRNIYEERHDTERRW